MKQFNLHTTKIAELTEDELQNLKKYLNTIPIKDYVRFLLHVLDTEITLCENTPEILKVSKFLQDKQFYFMRNTIPVISKYENLNDVTKEEWNKILFEIRIPQRKYKLKQIINSVATHP